MHRRAIAIAVLALAMVGLGTRPALATDEPRVPEEVASYFATGLVPRLADLYGTSSYDSTTKVGTVRRVLAFTTAFRSGADTTPTELTNNWVAPISSKGDVVLGLATVWINPGSDQPELANFAPGTATVAALAAAPTGALLVRDDRTEAWFASDGTTITPLVPGTSGIKAALPTAEFGKRLVAESPAPAAAGPPNQGLLVAGIVLGIVVVLLAGFVLLPDRRRRARGASEAVAVPHGPAPDPPAEPAADPIAPPVQPKRPATAKPKPTMAAKTSTPAKTRTKTPSAAASSGGDRDA
ncbi:hypothetical protein [Lacisediminihabitans sp.]|uniref:hypothetical protein n=1 Tax=Lacisediminihabitans sp. TaxID=2787631 RepID=UPI00374CA2F8